MPTGWPTPTPSPSIAPKGPPSTPPTSCGPAATASSPTSPPAAPATAPPIHLPADDLDQAIETLADDWTHSRRPAWAIDTTHPDPGDRRPAPPALEQLEAERQQRLARLRAERDAILAALPPARPVT